MCLSDVDGIVFVGFSLCCDAPFRLNKSRFRTAPLRVRPDQCRDCCGVWCCVVVCCCVVWICLFCVCLFVVVGAC